jgi:type VI secretion system protein ImpB
MTKSNSQKLLAEVRAPRVQIVYDVEVSGEQKSVELPFVMGVMADLSGYDAPALPPVKERRFVEIDAANFDRRMRDVSPGLQMQVPNHLGQEGVMDVRLQFCQMEDFRPDRVARQIPALASLLEAREKLSTLLSYMDGKTRASDLLQQVLDNTQLLQQIANSEKNQATLDGQVSPSKGE